MYALIATNDNCQNCDLNTGQPNWTKKEAAKTEKHACIRWKQYVSNSLKAVTINLNIDLINSDLINDKLILSFLMRLKTTNCARITPKTKKIHYQFWKQIMQKWWKPNAMKTIQSLICD